MADYGSLYQAAGTQWGVDPLLLQSLANEESVENPKAVGPVIQSGPDAGKRALGFMQFTPSTANQYNVNTSSPSSSVYGASNYLADLLYKQQLPLRQALATYGGWGGSTNNPYVNDIMSRYAALKNAWATPAAASAPSSAPPAVDTDPNSPTVGAPTVKNFTTPPTVPTFGTTAKGNPGQPATSVPTTAASDAPPGGIGYKFGAATPMPATGAPSGAPPPAPAPSAVPDYLAPFKQGKAIAAPVTPTPAAPGAVAGVPSDVPDYLAPFKEGKGIGEPATPMDTGEYLTAPQSPGAKAIATTPPSGPLEGFELPPGSQFKIGTATDPMQRVRIAASEAGVTPDSIIVGADNRLAAVGPNGVPYYLTPQRVFANQGGETRTDTDQGPNLRQLMWSGSGAVSDNANQPPGPWQRTGNFQFSPYATQSPLTPNAPGSFAPRNMLLGTAAALPSVAAQVPTAVGTATGEAAGGPLGGTIGTGIGAGLGEAGRQWLANRFDPNLAAAPEPVTGETVKNALIAAAGYGAGRWLQLDASAPATVLRPTDNWLYNRPQPITRIEPYGLENKLAPWEPRQRWEGVTRSEYPPAPGEPPAPSSPVPGAATPLPGPPPAPDVPSAEVAGVPQVKTDAQIAAEDRAIPTSAPPLRMPLVTDAAIDQRAKDIVRWYAQNGNTTPETGAAGSLTQLTGNRGLAALERGLRNEPGPVANEIGQLEDAQAAANRQTVANLRGDEDQLTALRQARQQQTAALEAKALAVKSPTDPSDVQNIVDQQLSSRAAQDPQVAAALRDVRDRLYQHDPITGKLTLDENGNPQLQTDPEQLMGLRQSIAREMTRAAQSGRPDMRLASQQLAPVLDQLDTAITRGMPNYPEFNAAYREASKPITAMEYLQGRNLVDTATQTPMLSAVQKTLDDIYRQRVLAHGWQPADDLSQDQIDQLTALRDQLRRQYNLRRGIAIGSPTVQNFATSQMTNLLMNPLMRYGRGAAAAALGAHEFGIGGYALGLGEAGIEALAAQRRQAVQQKLYSAIAKLLLNRNGEGVAALQEPP